MKNMNKKGADKILSIYWFAILVIIAVGVFVMVSNFYNHPYDVREIEANLLKNRMADCLSSNGQFKSNILDSEGNFLLNNENLLETCHLNFKAEDDFNWDETPQYYIETKIFHISDLNIPVLEVSGGNMNWKADCEIQKEGEYERLAKCAQGGFYSLGNNGQYLIKILSVVGKVEKNVK
ncbi:hypothetical protein ACFLZJ_00105 [Nanoarchaeota archaeon]